MKTRLFTAVATALVSASAFAAGGGATNDVTAPFAQNGGRAVTQQALGGSCTAFFPTQSTGRAPVVLWGNGTGASVSTYAAGLRHLASHNFVVVAANTSNAGAGTPLTSCLTTLTSSALAARADLTRVGTTGHSQGGGGAIMAGRDARVRTAAPLQAFTLGLGHDPASQGQQRTLCNFLASGSADTIASPAANQNPAFAVSNVPVFQANRTGASHFEPVGDFGDFRGALTAWFRYTLQGDPRARDLFAGPSTFLVEPGWSNRRNRECPL